MKRFFKKLNKALFRFVFLVMVFVAFVGLAKPQKIVDKTVATVSDGVRTELITYSDLVWQLALNPNVRINPPNSDDLNRALQIIIQQRLIALEAERLPSAPPKKEEVDKKINDVLALFPSPTKFIERLRIVGFDSISDENFQSLMRQRVAIEKYIDFRFRSFVVITPEDEKKYYRGGFTDQFRRQNPGLLLPKFEEVQARINLILTERKVENDIERFLDNAESRAEIVILNEV